MPSFIRNIGVSPFSTSPCPLPAFTSWYLFFCLHYSTSSIRVLLGLPFAVIPSNYFSNSSKAFEPLEPLKTWPAYVIFCVTTLFVKLFVTLSFQLIFNVSYKTTVQMRQFVISVFCWGSRFRLRIITLTLRNSLTIDSLFPASDFLLTILHAARKFLWPMQFLFSVTFSICGYYGAKLLYCVSLLVPVVFHSLWCHI